MKRFTKIISLAALAAIFAACGAKEEEQQVEKAPATLEEVQAVNGKPVRVTPAIKMKIADVRTFNGTIAGVNPASAIAKTSDPLKAIHVKVGSSVKKDQVIAEFEDTGDNITVQQLEEQVKLQEDVVRRMQEVFDKGGVTQQDLDSYEMQLRVYKLQLEQAKRANVVLAPAAGIVTRVNYDVGEVPSVGSVIVETAKLDQVILTLTSVTTKDIGIFKMGMSATVELNGQKVTGKVTRVPLAADASTRFFPVEITFNNKKNTLLPGMYVSTKIVAKTVEGVAVPNDAVVYVNGMNYVWTIEDGKAKRNLVHIGVADAENSQILDGITENAVVVTEGMSKLDDGIKVLIVE